MRCAVTPHQRKFEELVDMARLSAEPLPVILVGGGAILVGDVSDNLCLPAAQRYNHVEK